MERNTSVSLGSYFEHFVETKYFLSNEAVDDIKALRILHENMDLKIKFENN